MVGLLSDSSWQCYYILGTTTKLSMPKFSSFERLGLGLTVTEINMKKVQKQDLKNIKNVKDVGMAYQKVYKQSRDDIIVNFTKPYPYISLHYSCKLSHSTAAVQRLSSVAVCHLVSTPLNISKLMQRK